MYNRTKLSTICKLSRLKCPIKEVESTSFHSLTLNAGGKRIESMGYCSLYEKDRRKINTSSALTLIIPNESVSCDYDEPHHYEKIEQILSISPSEYLRRGKERRSKEQGIKTCIHSLTSLLEQSLQKDSFILGSFSKENVKRNLLALRNFERQIALPNPNQGDQPTNSLLTITSSEQFNKKHSYGYLFENYPITLQKEESKEQKEEKKEDEVEDDKNKFIDVSNLRNNDDSFEDIYNENSIAILHSIGEQKLPILAS